VAAEPLLASAEAVAEISANAAAALEPRLPTHRLRVLLLVGERPGMNLTGLARATGLTLPRASRMCGGMESAGLLERRPVRADRREIELVLTPHGLTVLTDYRARRAAELTGILRRMPGTACAELLAGLRAFASSLTAGNS
jgi:DNA-binding MarR family transcriptional regulator